MLGLEGETGYMRLSGNAFDPRTIISTQTVPDVLGSAKVGDWYGMVTGRLGYAWDRTLLYVKGGAAFVRTEASVLDACQNTAIGCGNWLISTSDSKTVTTWTVGGGLEWMLTPNCRSLSPDGLSELHAVIAISEICAAHHFHACQACAWPHAQAASSRNGQHTGISGACGSDAPAPVH